MHLSNFIPSVIVLGLMLPAAAFSVDGVILIDQNKALAGNVTPGDAPGFPVTISQPGSYRLDSNLTLPDVNTTAIIIASDNVTIDLNGFAIIGKNICGPMIIGNGPLPSFSCAPGTGTGIGITNDSQPRNNITVKNGTIQGMGNDGIQLAGGSFAVVGVHVASNGAFGIALSGPNNGPSIVKDSLATQNASDGILVRGIATHNTSTRNRGSGLTVVNGIAESNVSTGNQTFGLSVESSGYLSNVLMGNERGDLSNIPGRGLSLGQNFCGGSLCP